MKKNVIGIYLKTCINSAYVSSHSEKKNLIFYILEALYFFPLINEKKIAYASEMLLRMRCFLRLSNYRFYPESGRDLHPSGIPGVGP